MITFKDYKLFDFRYATVKDVMLISLIFKKEDGGEFRGHQYILMTRKSFFIYLN
jgi:hypothetical protein